MDLDKILAVTFSGLRPEEKVQLLDLIRAGGLAAEDLTDDKLRHFIVARKGTRVVGAVGLEIAGPEALLRSLVVADDFRRRGIATRLTTAVERYARQMGVDALYLLTLTADRFFRKQGYSACPRDDAPQALRQLAEFDHVCPATAVCMHKHLER